MLPLADINGPSLGVFIHVLSVVLTFGVIFAYPIVDMAFGKALDKRHLPFWHRAQAVIGQRLIAPGGVLILLSGLYLVLRSNGPWSMGDAFVSGGLAILIIAEGLGGAYLGPRELRLAELAERDIAASPGGTITLSAEYTGLHRTVQMVQLLLTVLVIVAVFLMVIKPGV